MCHLRESRAAEKQNSHTVPDVSQDEATCKRQCANGSITSVNFVCTISSISNGRKYSAANIGADLLAPKKWQIFGERWNVIAIKLFIAGNGKSRS
jgi:hypothetical protein